MNQTVIITRLPHGEGLPLPRYATGGSAGADLHSAADVTIGPGGRAIVPTGIRMSLPPMMEGQIRPRSGLAARDGVTVLNAPGTIDSDYRGEVLVLLVNHGLIPFEVRRGDRIAQIVFAWTLCPRMVEASEVEETARGAGGFGSTGMRP